MSFLSASLFGPLVRRQFFCFPATPLSFLSTHCSFLADCTSLTLLNVIQKHKRSTTPPTLPSSHSCKVTRSLPVTRPLSLRSTRPHLEGQGKHKIILSFYYQIHIKKTPNFFYTLFLVNFRIASLFYKSTFPSEQISYVSVLFGLPKGISFMNISPPQVKPQHLHDIRSILPAMHLPSPPFPLATSLCLTHPQVAIGTHLPPPPPTPPSSLPPPLPPLPPGSWFFGAFRASSSRSLG